MVYNQEGTVSERRRKVGLRWGLLGARFSRVRKKPRKLDGVGEEASKNLEKKVSTEDQGKRKIRAIADSK